MKKVMLGITLWLMLLGTMVAVAFAPLSSNVQVSPPVTELSGERALVFFGYPGCHSVCPLVLSQLDDVIKALPAQQPSPEVIFVNLAQTGSQQETTGYAQAFNQNFIGMKPSPEQLEALSREYGLNFASKGTDIEHRGRAYLIEKRKEHWYLRKAYPPSGGLAQLVLRDLED